MLVVQLKLPACFYPLILVVACLEAVFLPVRCTHAAALRDGVPDSEYRQHADPYQGAALWISHEYNGGRRFGASGVRLNEWYGLCTAHQFFQGANQYTNARVGTGPNFMTNRAVTRRITNILIVPGYNSFIDDPRNNTDLAIVKFDKPLPGPNLRIGTFTLDGDSTEDDVTSVGFGRAGYVATGFTIVDGHRRAFDYLQGYFFFDLPHVFSSDLFDNGLFGLGAYYAGRGMSGDSGSPGFNSAGELVTTLNGGSLPLNVASWGGNHSTYLEIFRDWITTNTVVAEPRLTMESSGTNVVIRWNGDYVLQSSALAAGTYIDVSSASSPHTNTASEPAQFFRLASLPEPPLPAPAVATNLGTLGAAANATAYYCGHSVAGALATSSAAMRMPAAPGDDGGVVQAPYLPTLNSTGAFSAELWLKPGQTNNAAALMDTHFEATAGPRGGWRLLQSNAAQTTGNGFTLLCAITPGERDQVIVSQNLPIDTNAWHHLVAVFDGTNFTLYVNGAVAAMASLPAGQSVRANPFLPLTIGTTTEYGRWFSGDLDEVAVYTNALSAAQVLAHYETGTNAAPATPYEQVVLADGPAGYWRLDEPSAPLVAAPVPPPHLPFPVQPLALQPKAAPRSRSLPPLQWEINLWEMLYPPATLEMPESF
jgi:hypothetical protein